MSDLLSAEFALNTQGYDLTRHYAGISDHQPRRGLVGLCPGQYGVHHPIIAQGAPDHRLGARYRVPVLAERELPHSGTSGTGG
jgi:hypothetical protein